MPLQRRCVETSQVLGCCPSKVDPAKGQELMHSCNERCGPPPSVDATWIRIQDQDRTTSR